MGRTASTSLAIAFVLLVLGSAALAAGCMGLGARATFGPTVYDHGIFNITIFTDEEIEQEYLELSVDIYHDGPDPVESWGTYEEVSLKPGWSYTTLPFSKYEWFKNPNLRDGHYVVNLTLGSDFGNIGLVEATQKFDVFGGYGESSSGADPKHSSLQPTRTVGPVVSFSGVGDRDVTYSTTTDTTWLRWQTDTASPDHPFTIDIDSHQFGRSNWGGGFNVARVTEPGSGVLENGPTAGWEDWSISIRAAGPWKLDIFTFEPGTTTCGWCCEWCTPTPKHAAK